MTQVCNFAEDTTFYVCDKDLNTLINRLEHDTALAVEWFENNFMKLNQDKCHLLVPGHKQKTVWANIGETKINKNCLIWPLIEIWTLMNMFLIYVKKLIETVCFTKINKLYDFWEKKNIA